MKASKLLVLLGGILGIAAFFMPLVTVHENGDKVSLSAFAVIKGHDSVAVQVTHDGQKERVDVDTSGDPDLDKIKGILGACFGPSALLLLVGLIAVARGKFGRLGGVLALLFGGLALGVGLIMKNAAGNDSGLGLTLLLASGAAGGLGGLLALISPDRGNAAA